MAELICLSTLGPLGMHTEVTCPPWLAVPRKPGSHSARESEFAPDVGLGLGELQASVCLYKLVRILGQVAIWWNYAKSEVVGIPFGS